MRSFLNGAVAPILACSLAAWANPQEKTRRYEEFHRRLREHLLLGGQDTEAWLKDMDKMMEEMMADAWTPDLGALTEIAPGPALEWSSDARGRLLTVTPAHPDDKLDVQVQEGRVRVSATLERPGARGSARQEIPVPEDCDPDQVKMEGENGKLLLFFPFRKQNFPPGTPPQKQT